eukprot:g8377.t1
MCSFMGTCSKLFLKRKAYAFKQWHRNTYLQTLVDREKQRNVQRQLESFILYVCQEVRDVLESDRCSLWMLDDGKLYAQQPDGLGSALSKSVSGTSLVAECARTKEVVHTKDAYYTEGFNQHVDQLTGYRTKSVLRRKARAWTLQQRVRFKPQGKTAGRRNSATARNPERSRSLLDTHLNTFRRNLERNVSMADEADAIEVAKDLPDLRVVMANFVSFVDGSDKKRRSSLNGTALINAISEAASDMSVALYAAKLVKDRMVKAERMLRIEQRKSTTLKVAVDELAKKPKTQNVRLDTEDLNVWSDQRTKVRRLFFRTKRIKIRQAFQHWLQRLGMKFYATYFEAKKNRKMQQLFIRRSQRVKSYGLQRMKLYVINHQRSLSGKSGALSVFDFEIGVAKLQGASVYRRKLKV